MTPVPHARVTSVLATLLAGLTGLVMAWLVLELPRDVRGLTALVRENLAMTGVNQPVTAVLLNFRGYDTWLEVGVLTLTLLGILLVRREVDLTTMMQAHAGNPMLRRFVWLIFPIIVISSGHILLLGTSVPGGAFPAGALLGSGGILLRLAGYPSVARLRRWELQLSAALGLIGYLGVIAVLLLGGWALLELPLPWAGSLILFIESLITISVGIMVTSMFVGAAPPPRE